MDTSAVIDVLREAVGVLLKLCGPMLVLCMLVGVVVAIFQAVTQIHEQTISFVLKLVVIIAVLLLGGGWMLTTLQDYTMELLALITG
jgi:flagellar biosynthetic protein FliQ